MLKPEFVRRVHECTDDLVAATIEPGPTLLIGTITNDGGQNFNTLLLAEGGKVVGRTFKHELPNYGTFDEKRIFTPGPLPKPIEWRGSSLACRCARTCGWSRSARTSPSLAPSFHRAPRQPL